MERQAVPADRHRRRRHRRPQPDHAADRRAGARRDRRGGPRAVHRRRARRRDAGRRGACADPARVEEGRAADREQDRRSVAGGARARPAPARLRRAVPDLGPARLEHRRPARRGDRPATWHLVEAGVRRRDPGRDPRPAERRQVVALQQARRRGAHDRRRGAGDDARHDRHGRADGGPHLHPRRHCGAAPQAQAAAGDRLLLGAARARSGGAGRRCAGADRRERGNRRGRHHRCRGRAQVALGDVDRALEVGHLDDHDRGSAPRAAAPAASASRFHHRLVEVGPRCLAPARQDSRALRPLRGPRADRRAEQVHRRAERDATAALERRRAGSTSSTAPRSRRVRRGSGSPSTIPAW